MPLPLFFIGAAVATSALGIGKTVKAHVTQKEANETNEEAFSIYERAKSRATQYRTLCDDALKQLGLTKLEILDGSVRPFITLFQQLKSIKLEESQGLNELNNLQIDKQSLRELREMSDMASSLLGGTLSGTVMGAATAFAAYGGVMTFGAASTGTAIASLSGVAATNATLAFLGGGTLAAGGLGMAGGAAVLGGLVAGPALAVLGFVVDAKASANRDVAYANLAKAKEFREEVQTICTLCHGIRMRSMLFQRLILKLNALFDPCVFALSQTIQISGTDYSRYSEREKATVAMCLALVKAIKTLLDTPILTPSGCLSQESATIAEQTQEIVEQYA